MGVNWDDIETSYAELQAARGAGQASLLMRISEMQMSLAEALDAHVAECAKVDNFSWQRIGDALGITRQAASKRWARRVFPHS